jgi:hypothetical protein
MEQSYLQERFYAKKALPTGNPVPQCFYKQTWHESSNKQLQNKKTNLTTSIINQIGGSGNVKPKHTIG